MDNSTNNKNNNNADDDNKQIQTKKRFIRSSEITVSDLIYNGINLIQYKWQKIGKSIFLMWGWHKFIQSGKRKMSGCGKGRKGKKQKRGKARARRKKIGQTESEGKLRVCWALEVRGKEWERGLLSETITKTETKVQTNSNYQSLFSFLVCPNTVRRYFFFSINSVS